MTRDPCFKPYKQLVHQIVIIIAFVLVILEQAT